MTNPKKELSGAKDDQPIPVVETYSRDVIDLLASIDKRLETMVELLMRLLSKS